MFYSYEDILKKKKGVYYYITGGTPDISPVYVIDYPNRAIVKKTVWIEELGRKEVKQFFKTEKEAKEFIKKEKAKEIVNPKEKTIFQRLSELEEEVFKNNN